MYSEGDGKRATDSGRSQQRERGPQPPCSKTLNLDPEAIAFREEIFDLVWRSAIRYQRGPSGLFVTSLNTIKHKICAHQHSEGAPKNTDQAPKYKPYKPLLRMATVPELSCKVCKIQSLRGKPVKDSDAIRASFQPATLSLILWIQHPNSATPFALRATTGYQRIGQERAVAYRKM